MSRAALEPLCDRSLLAAVRATLKARTPAGNVGVALSAGPDSAMLAVHAACAARGLGLALHCLHIHHGLQPQADAWLQQAHRLADLLEVSCHSLRVKVELQGRGMEAAARAARYDALADLAHRAGVRDVLLAHHGDDQAETVLLRLLRGAGPLGLAAMSSTLERDGLIYHRPWLAQPRALILGCAQRFADASGWYPVHDASNRDPRYARGALRTSLAPALDAGWPAWRQILCRHAEQARELSGWVSQEAAQDWQRLDPAPDGSGFSLAAWRSLPAARQVSLLRHWLAVQGLRMPTDARLRAWLHQLRGVHALGHDRNVRLPHEGACIVVRRGRVVIEPETQVK